MKAALALLLSMSGVEGTVSYSICPADTVPACLAAPVLLVNATVIARDASSGQIAGQAHTSEIGQFRIELAPAEYVLHATPDDPQYLPCRPAAANVVPGAYTTVAITCVRGASGPQFTSPPSCPATIAMPVLASRPFTVAATGAVSLSIAGRRLPDYLTFTAGVLAFSPIGVIGRDAPAFVFALVTGGDTVTVQATDPSGASSICDLRVIYTLF